MDPLLLLVSTGEVYGAGPPGRRGRETAPLLPLSPYAASKVGAEVAALEAWRRSGLRVMSHGRFPYRRRPKPGLVVPAFAVRLRAARALGRPRPCRRATRLRCATSSTCVTWSRPTACSLERGRPGEAYNVARGDRALAREVFRAARGDDRRGGGAGGRSGADPRAPTSRISWAIRLNSGAPRAGRRRSRSSRLSGTGRCPSGLTSRPSSSSAPARSSSGRAPSSTTRARRRCAPSRRRGTGSSSSTRIRPRS